MNRDQKKRITQNITYLKERLIDLDPILDILIERDVLSMDHRTRIEQILQPTPQRKFNEFIQILLASPEPTAYDTFIEALDAERHYAIVDRLQTSVVKDGPGGCYGKPLFAPPRLRQPNRQSTFHGMPSVVSDEVGAAGGSRTHVNGKFDTMVDAMQHVLEEFGTKMTEEIMSRMEMKHTQERQDLEWKMEQRLERFDQEWQAEKQDLLRKNDEAISELQAYIEKLKTSDEDYKNLKDQYEKLQSHQEEMRERENERWQRLSKSNMENVQLRKENEDLRTNMQNLHEQIRDYENDKLVAKDNEKQDRLLIENLKAEIKILQLQLQEKEQENERLKQDLESAYTKIHQSVSSQKEKSSTEDTAYVEALKKQEEKLEEIYAAVSDLTYRDRANGNQKPLSRGLHMYGTAMPRGTKNIKGNTQK